VEVYHGHGVELEGAQVILQAEQQGTSSAAGRCVIPTLS
jgi:hypothetical protein